MAEVDDELIHRAIRWCADAGRQASAADVRTALAALSWDQLLAARAWLADPPPARPLGPWALADMARGALPDAAAERERQGQYQEVTATAYSAAAQDAGAMGAPAPVRPPRGKSRARTRLPAGPFIHRVRDRTEAGPAPAPARPLVEELFASEGRSVLERIIREHGARRAPILAALAKDWSRGDGAPPSEDDLDRLLDTHGLARAFERRERDELLHALRKGGGVSAQAAPLVGLSPEAFTAAIERLGASRQAESIRNTHRQELRRGGTLSERVRLLLTEAERLAGLGMVEEIEQDLRQRLPEHVRAMQASGASPLVTALARTLAIAPGEVLNLTRRLGVDLHAPPLAQPRGARAGSAPRSAAAARPPTSAPPGRAGATPRPSTRPGSMRPASPRPASARPGSARPPRPGSPRPGSPRPASARSTSARPTSRRAGAPRTGSTSPRHPPAGRPRRR